MNPILRQQLPASCPSAKIRDCPSISFLTQIQIHTIYLNAMPNPSKVKYTPFTWEETRTIVDNNHLTLLARSPQMTAKYLDFKQRLKQSGVSILDHVLASELGWSSDDLIEEVEGVQLMQPEHLKVIYNLFPYYFADDVIHLCVWSKVRILPDAASAEGDISPQTKDEINQYIRESITKPLGLEDDNVCWFKNWDSLQSVKAISHVHVLLRGALKEDVNALFSI